MLHLNGRRAAGKMRSRPAHSVGRSKPPAPPKPWQVNRDVCYDDLARVWHICYSRLVIHSLRAGRASSIDSPK